MQDIPSYVSITFLVIVASVLAILFYAISAAEPGKKNLTPSLVITLLVTWVFFISVQTFSGFFTELSGLPRLPLMAAVIFLAIVAVFAWPRSRKIVMKMPITTLHYLHIVRVPVEMVLWWLAAARMIPVDMTFEGSNLDIISGISAPFAAVFMVSAKSKSKLAAILWNLISLGLLVNIVTLAIKYSPYLYTPTNAEVGNLGVFFFPYILLPTFVVPAVFFCHLAALYQLLWKKDQLQY